MEFEKPVLVPVRALTLSVDQTRERGDGNGSKGSDRRRETVHLIIWWAADKDLVFVQICVSIRVFRPSRIRF